MENRHKIQMDILGKLLFANGLSYTNMKPEYHIENNQYQYHLDKLLTDHLVYKEKGLYQLTQAGKEFANLIKTENNRVVRQGKIAAVPVCIREVNGETEVLIYKRLKQPFYGKEGVPSGKVEFGEKVIDAVQRELFEETHLRGEANLFQITHWRTQDKSTGRLLEDKYFHYFVITEIHGELDGCAEGEYRWVNVNNISDEVSNPFDTIGELEDLVQNAIDSVNTTKVDFTEYVHITDGF